jgi:hypothetical protein
MAKKKDQQPSVEDIMRQYGGSSSASSSNKQPSTKELYRGVGLAGTPTQDKWKTDTLTKLSKKTYGNTNDEKLLNLFGGDPWAAKDFERWMNYRSANQDIANFKANEAYGNWLDSFNKNQAKQQQELSKKKAKQTKDESFLSKITPNFIENGVSKVGDVLSSLTKNVNTNAKNNTAAGMMDAQARGKAERDRAKANGERTGILGELDRTIGRMSELGQKTVLGQGFVDAQNANYRRDAEEALKKNPNDKLAQQALQTLNATTRPAQTTQEKAFDFLGQSAGEIAPYLVGGADALGAKAVAKMVGEQAVPKLAQTVARGAISGAVASAEKQAARGVASGENLTPQQRLEQMTKEAALMGGFNAAFHLGGAGLKRIFGKVESGQPIEQIAKEEGMKPEDISALYDHYKGRAFQTEASGQVIDANAPRLNAPTPEEAKLLNGPTVNPNQLDQSLGLNEPIVNRTFNTGKPVEVKGTPQLNAPENLGQIENDLKTIYDQRKAEEDAFVQQQMAPHIEAQKRQAEGQAVWEHAVKTAKSEIERIKGTYGKISVPKGSREDFNIPKQFRASLSDKHADDIHSFATQEGFSSVDDAVQYLQNLEKDSKIRMKDLMGEGKPMTEDVFTQLENAAREAYRKSGKGQALDNLFSNLMKTYDETASSYMSDGAPLSFKKEKGFIANKEPVQYTGKMNPKDQVATRAEGSYTTRQADSPSGDTLKMNVDHPTPEQPLQFKTQAEQQGMKQTVKQERVRKDITEVDGRKQNVNNSQVSEPYSVPKNELQSYIDNYKGKSLRGDLVRKFNLSDVEAKQILQDMGPKPKPTGGGAPLGATYGGVASPNGSLKGAIDFGSIAERNLYRRPKEGIFAKAFNRFSRLFNDDGIYVKVMENNLKGKGRFSSEGKAYQLFNNARGSASQAEYDLTHKLLPIFQKVSKSGQDLVEAFNYRYALHLKEILDMNPAYKLPKNLTEADLENTIRLHENNTHFQAFNDEMTQYFKDIQEELVSSGRLSQAQVDAMNTDYQFYLPKYRLKDVDNPEVFDQAFFNDFGPMSSKNPIKRISDGSNEMIMDPVEAITLYTQRARQSAANNRALRELDDLVSLDTEGKWISNDPNKKGTPIKFFVDGKERVVYADKDVAEAYLKGSLFEKEAMSGFLKGAAKLQRMSITGTPAFALRNMMRDIPQAWANSRAGMGVRDIVGSALDMFSGGKWSAKMGQTYYDDFLQSGAGMSNVWSQDSKAFRQFQEQAYKQYKGKGYIDVSPTELKAGKVMMNLMDKYRKTFLEKAENLAKYAEFRATMRKGGDTTQAAYNARDMMDFFRAGKGTRYVNPYLSFFNTTLQGRSKFVRSFAENIADKNWKGLTRVAWRNSLVATAPSAAAWWAYHQFASQQQKEMIDEAPDYLKNTYWLLPASNGEDLIRIPKPFETAALATPFEYYLRKMEGLDQNAKAETQDWIMRNLIFDPSLNIASPIYEVATNTDLNTGGQIADLGLPPSAQKDINTSGLAELVAGGLGKVGLDNTRMASPKMIDELINGYLPIAGRGSRGTVDNLLETLGVAKKKNLPANSIKNPFKDLVTGKQFVVKGNGQNTPLLGDLFDSRDKLQGIKKANGGEMPNDQLKQDYDIMNKAYKQVSDLSKVIKGIANDPKLDSQTKQDYMNVLIQQRNQVARDLQKLGIYKRTRESWK